MSKTVIEYVWGELLRDGKTAYNVKLKLTVREMMVNESFAPVARAVARHDLTPMSGVVIKDGKYTLRYVFDGNQQEYPVRVQGETLLAA